MVISAFDFFLMQILYKYNYLKKEKKKKNPPKTTPKK